MSSSPPPLHKEAPKNRFSNRAQSYSRYRPDYPSSVYEGILDGFGSSSITVADLGAGTGISSRGIADAGARVIAIEPNEAMRAAAESHPLVEFRDGSGEHTTLAAHSVEIVTAFQAFHWFDAELALREAHRILKQGGRIALIWNLRDPGDPFTSAYTDIVHRFATIPAAEERAGVADPLMRSGFFKDSELLSFAHFQDLTLEGLEGRARSTSYLPSEGPRWEELAAELKRLHQEWTIDGIVRLAYRTDLYRARGRS